MVKFKADRGQIRMYNVNRFKNERKLSLIILGRFIGLELRFAYTFIIR